MLRSLELFGFKSFADRTVFEFHEGITGVVGPNGSGKSNVVDSIKWLLGDQSAKSLRGKEMTDVIFNGSASRGGAQFAEATLTFDNTTRYLPIDHDEVAIGRRLWKSGDSEYLINNQVARLKDVRELLMGTGAGTASYCIIEQGRVDQILQSNAANRRLIFEEAAGITRLKQRKTEAERRLERVEQNLLRLTDIVDEVGSQVRSIRSQAKRAMQYRTVTFELERLWVGTVADDFRRQNMVRGRLTEQLQQAQATLQDMQQRQQLAEAQLHEAEQALASVDEDLREAEHSRAELRSRIASLETTLRHQTARHAELESEFHRLQRQRTLMDTRVQEAEKEEEHLKSVLELETRRLEERQQEQENNSRHLTELQQSLRVALSSVQATRKELTEKNRIAAELASHVSALQHERQSLSQRREELQAARQTLEREIQDLEQQLKDHQLQLEELQKQLNQAEEAADARLGERETLVSQQQESRESLAELREQRSAALARKSVLEDLEDRQEGFGIGARELLRRAEESDLEPWNLIRGSVADLLDVDMENAALLEVALSGRAQLIVIDRLAPLVEYINAGRLQVAGRVGFVSLEDAPSPPGALPPAASRASEPQASPQPDTQESWADEPGLGMFGDDWLDSSLGALGSDEFLPRLNVTWVDENGQIPPAKSVFASADAAAVSLMGKPAVVGRADSLARSPRHLPGLATQLLADTWVVESLDHALQLHEELGSEFRFVTLQGELVEKDQTLFTGTVRSESAVVSRKSELRRLKNELHRIDHLIAERDLRLRELVSSIEVADTELRRCRDNVEQVTSTLQAEQQQFARLQQTLNSSRKHDQSLSEQLQAIDNNLQQLEGRMADVTAEQRAADNEVTALQNHIQAAEETLEEDRRQIQILEETRTDASLELTRTEERLRGIQDAVQRLREDLQQRILQQREAGRRLAAGNSRLAELNLSRLNVAAEISELLVYEEKLTTEIDRRAGARQILKTRRQEAGKAAQEARAICAQHEKQAHELQLKLQGIDHQLETAAERIQEEYHITVEEAVDRGASAVAAWLEDEERRQQAANGDVEDEADSEDTSDSNDSLLTSQPPAPEMTPQAEEILRDDERFDALRANVDKRISELRQRLRKLGNVGTDSLENLVELEQRFERLHSQLQDLEAARDTLREMVEQINVESRRLFEESFACIQEHFRELFRRLFGGGEADVILEDPEDVLDCAIDVVARPPGKELRSLSLLSGGEKTMTAVALLLAIFKSRPSPFCILDEVDAALDDANIGRFVGVLRDFRKDTQFIMITHRKPTMAVTDVLYGVTMEESGISKRLVVRFEEIDEQGNFVPRDDEQNKAA